MNGLANWDRVRTVRSILHAGEKDLEQIPEAVLELYKSGVWKEYDAPDDNHYSYEETQFQQFVENPPEGGLDIKRETLEYLCRNRPQMKDDLVSAMDGELRDRGAPEGSRNNPEGKNQYTQSDEEGGDKPDNIRFNQQSYGTSETYAYRRLKRDRPDLHAEVIEGEKTAHAAMVEAGFRKKYVQVEPTPEAVEKFLERHLPGYRLVKDE